MSVAISLISVVVAIVAVLITIAGFWLTRLRGPVIRPITSGEEPSLILHERPHSVNMLTRIPFDLKVALANYSGTAGMVRGAKIEFTPVEALQQHELAVQIDTASLKPADSGQGERTHAEFVELVPPFSLRMLHLECFLRLVNWERAPLELFTPGCNLARVQLDHFSGKKAEALELLSILEKDDLLGTIDVRFQSTERRRPIRSPLAWKEREIVSRRPLRTSRNFLRAARSQLDRWAFDADPTRDRYVSFLGYLQQQANEIRKTLAEKPASPTRTAFPDEREYGYERESLCRKDPEFRTLWYRLIEAGRSYSGVLRALEAQASGRAIDRGVEQEIQSIVSVLTALIGKCKELHGLVIDEFQKPGTAPS